MILPTLIPNSVRIPTTPYDISYYEPMHKWEIKKKFAFVPQTLWEYEDGTSVVHSMAPDDYRVFIKTESVVWLEYYYEIEAYTRNTITPINRTKNTKRRFAIEEYYYLQKLL